MTAKWELYVLEYARSRNQPVASLIQGAFDEGVMNVPFAFVLARNGKRNVLIDSGFMNKGGGAEMATKFDIPWWISPVRLLGELGVLAEQVTDIFISHAHFDHMGGIGEFPNAMIYMQKREYLSWLEAMALPPRFGFLTAAVSADDLRSALDASVDHRLTLLEGDKDNVLPGIHARFGEGHTLGQQFVVVESAKGRMVVSGDCVYAARNITGNNNDGVYVPLAFGVGSIWEQLKTIDRINDEIAGDISRIIILHDADRWSKMPIIKEIDGFRILRAA
jgi:glyoxylase-like metal-dependent hydrolase (beta-lactamase superfamily II)